MIAGIEQPLASRRLSSSAGGIVVRFEVAVRQSGSGSTTGMLNQHSQIGISSSLVKDLNATLRSMNAEAPAGLGAEVGAPLQLAALCGPGFFFRMVALCRMGRVRNAHRESTKAVGG